jgi:hypothetical protein
MNKYDNIPLLRQDQPNIDDLEQEKERKKQRYILKYLTKAKMRGEKLQ